MNSNIRDQIYEEKRGLIIGQVRLATMNSLVNRLEWENDDIAEVAVRNAVSERLAEIRLLLRDGHLNATPPSPPSQPDTTGYAFASIEDFERCVGYTTNDAFRGGWRMARTTKRMLGV
jgi:hypothetical protein